MLTLLSLGMHCNRPIARNPPPDPASQDETSHPLQSGSPVQVLSGPAGPVVVGATDTLAAQVAIEAQEPWLLVTVPAHAAGVRFRWTDLGDAQPGARLDTGAQVRARGDSSGQFSFAPEMPVHVFLVRPEADAKHRRGMIARVQVRRRDASEFAAAALLWNPTPSQCGNELVEPNETCDDGNLTPGDGCDSCAVEAMACDRERPGFVRYWDCAGLPNRCAQKTCDPAVGECPTSLPTRHTIAISIVETGAVTNASANVVESTPPGIACTCTETFRGRVCSDTCTADFPVCTPVRLSAGRASTTGFSGWAGACTGDDRTCPIDLVAKNRSDHRRDRAIDSAVTAYFHAPSPIAQMVSLPIAAWGRPRIRLGRDGRLLVLSTYDSIVEVGGHRLVSNDGPGHYAAELWADGRMRRAWDLGQKNQLVPLGAALDDRGVWIATAEGDMRHHARAPKSRTYPRYHIRRYERGALSFNRKLPYYMGERADLQIAPNGGALVALEPSRQRKDGGWRSGGATAILWLQPDGSVQRRWEFVTEVWSSTRAIRLLPSGRVIAAGLFDGQVTAESPLQPVEDGVTDGLYRIELSADGKTKNTRSQALSQDSRGAIAIDASGTITHVQALYRPRAWQLLRWSGATTSATERATASTCHRVKTGDIVTVDDATGRIAIAELECGPVSQRAQPRALTIHLVSATGAHQHTWRLGGPAAQLEFGGMEFAPDGQIVVATRMRGTVTLGRRTLRSHEQRLLLVWLPTSMHRF